MNNFRKKYLSQILGTVLLVFALILGYFEYQRINIENSLVPLGDYYDYSILLYVGHWFLYVILLLTSIVTIFKLNASSFFLILFGLGSFLEFYFNINIYIIPSMTESQQHILLVLGIISLIFGFLNLLEIKKISFTEIILAISLAFGIIYLPNGLITFYF